MTKRVGTWWIKSGLDARREEAQGFGEILDAVSGFSWTQNHGENNVLKKDFVETSDYSEKVDQVDILFMCSHGEYDPDDSSTWGRAFCVWGDTVHYSDHIDWGKGDLEVFSTHACRLLYHASGNSVGRWIPAFERLHYIFGFHTPSTSGGDRKKRGSQFALYAILHLLPWPFPDYTLRTAWKKANVEVEDSDVEWAYLRANGETSSGEWVSTYSEKLEVGEPKDPSKNREFWTARGTC